MICLWCVMQVRDGLYFQPDYGILTPAPDSTWHIFSKYFISTQLTYEWFKYTFICKEQASVVVLALQTSSYKSVLKSANYIKIERDKLFSSVIKIVSSKLQAHRHYRYLLSVGTIEPITCFQALQQDGHSDKLKQKSCKASSL